MPMKQNKIFLYVFLTINIIMIISTLEILEEPEKNMKFCVINSEGCFHGTRPIYCGWCTYFLPWIVYPFKSNLDDQLEDEVTLKCTF
jgi:hypothetical protein